MPESSHVPPRNSTPVAIYARVSTAQQCGHRFSSCEHQVNICRDYLRKQSDLGWHEVGCITDEAYSGCTLERPGIRRLKAAINAGTIKIVLIYKLERILRSTSEWSHFSQFLAQHDCRLISPNEDLSDSSASGRLKTNILMSFAEYERLNVAEKIRSKMLAHAKRGMWGGGLLPFGYDYDLEQQRLILNQEQAAIVRQIFARAAASVPLRQVARELNEAGFRTRIRSFRTSDRGRRRVGGKPFRADVLKMLIRNPIYRGVIRHNGHEYRGQHTQLVSDDVWEIANASINHVGTTYRPRSLGRDKYSNLLKGIVVCERCGQMMLSKASGKVGADSVRYRYYSCKRVREAGDEQKCPTGEIKAEALEKGIIGFLGQLPEYRAAFDSFLHEISGSGDKQGHQAKVLDRVNSQLTKLDLQVSNCVEVLAAKGVSELTDELKRKVGRLNRKREKLRLEQRRQQQALVASQNMAINQDRIRLAMQKFSQVLPTLDQPSKRSMLQSVLHLVSIRRLPATIETGARVYRLLIGIRIPELLVALVKLGGADYPNGRMPTGGRCILDLTAELVIGPKRRIAIQQPFTAELGETPVRPPRRPRTILCNPILRAQEWEEKLRNTTGLSIRRLAKIEGRSPTLVSLHLKLLTMAPDIVTQVKALRSAEALRIFSYRALLGMAKHEPKKQRKIFAKLMRLLPPGC